MKDMGKTDPATNCIDPLRINQLVRLIWSKSAQLGRACRRRALKHLLEAPLEAQLFD